jgi:tetratricopeptide (TPR) repeat protein
LRGNYVLAGDSYSKALGLDAANPNALNQYSYMLACLGYMSQAIAMRQRLQAVEPFVPIFAAISAVILSLSGQIDDAITLAKPLAMGGIPLGELYAAKGNYSEAVEAIRSIPAGVFLPGTTEAAAGLLSAGPKAAASLRAPPRLGILSWVYAYVGAPDRFWDLFDDAVGIAHIHYLGTVIWSRSFADLRKSKRFGAYIRDYGILDFWHAKGFPDLCRPLGIGDFVCD